MYEYYNLQVLQAQLVTYRRTCCFTQVVADSGNQYHILLIIADGQVCQGVHMLRVQGARAQGSGCCTGWWQTPNRLMASSP